MSLLIGAMGVGGLLSFGIATSHLPTVGASSETLRGSPDTARTSWHGANAVPVRYGPAGSGALVTVAPAHGYVATPANVSGGGFAASTAISLTFGTTAISTCSAGGLTTNSTGNFTCVFAVPILASGSYSIGATDGVSVASAPFTIDPPTLGLAPGSGVIGSLIDASGSGYAPSTPLTVTFGPTPITTCGSGSLMANATGNLSCSFVVPTARAGPVDVNATDGTNAATAVFALSAPTIAVAPTSGVIGSDAHLTGGGFSLLTRLTVDFGATALASCTSGSLRTNATGALDCTFPVPSTPAGTATINASDGTNFATVGFVVLAPTLALVPNTGWVGSSATASGNGFVPSNALTLDFGTNSITSCSAGGLTANATGALNCTFQVPTVAAGTYSVNASDGTNYATASFVVGPPTLSLAPTSGYVGTPVVASGAGYRASTVVTITFAGIAVSTCTSGSLRTSAQGDLSCTFSVPHATTGTRTVLVSDGTNTASASYTVLPDLTLSPANGTIGTAVLAVGTGFDATSSFTVSWNATFSLYAGTTDASGGFSFSFDVPNAPGGGHVVTAQEGANTATAGFSVLPSLTLNPTAGTVGRDVNVHASGLDAATAYTASWDGTVTLCAGTTDANGNALCSFDVPAAPRGSTR